MNRTWDIKNAALVTILVLGMAGCGIFENPPAAQRAGVVPGQTITVNGNQNLYAIAQANGVSMRDIIVLNNLHEPFTLKSGQSLVLPFKRGDVASPVSSGLTSTAAGDSGSMAAAPMGSIQSEELPPPIATKPQPTSLPPLQQPQNLPPPAKPKAGPVDVLNAPAAPPPKPVTTTMAAPPPAPAPAAPAVASSSAVTPAMIWPVQGPLLSGFGPKGSGVNNDGVNIGAPKGSPVVAAASGIVVYAGNEMKGFGNLVLIRHEGGWVTAYAYLDRTLVAKDAVVAQGDMIGTVGKTGNVSSPQLHFETRQNGKPVDPNGVVKAD